MKEIEVEGDKEKEGVVFHKLEDVKSQMFFHRDGISLISLTRENYFKKGERYEYLCGKLIL